MSSPISPLTDAIDRLRQQGGNAINMIGHPVQAMHNMLMPPDPHQQAIQQMNQQLNAHRNDAANASFVHPQPQQSTGVLTQAAKRPRP